MKYYHNPRCRKSREGLQYLEELNIRPTIIEYLKNPLNKEELKEILKQLKYSPTDLLRKNEIVYKTHIKNKYFLASKYGVTCLYIDLEFRDKINLLMSV